MNDIDKDLWLFNNNEKRIVNYYHLTIARTDDNKIVIMKNNKLLKFPKSTITIDDIKDIIFS